jgi:cytoskeletal protein CcmA (bactofilin family)
MFSNRNTESHGTTDETVIAGSLKIEGNVTAEGLVTVHGTIVGDLRCTALNVSEKARITGAIRADSIVINGTVEGPVHGTDVVLKPHAHVIGDIHHTSLSIEKGARFDGRSKQADSSAPEVEIKAVKTEKRVAAE